MAGGHAVAKVSKEFFPLIVKRRYKDALKAVPKQYQEVYAKYFANWKHDNVASPETVVDENFIARKYPSIPMEPPVHLGLKSLLTFPKDPVAFRNQQMIHLEKIQQQNYVWLESGENPYEKSKYYRYIFDKTVYYMIFAFAIVPFFVVTVVFNKTKFYRNWFEGGIFDKRRAPYQKKPWENLVKNEQGEWVEK